MRRGRRGGRRDQREFVEPRARFGYLHSPLPYFAPEHPVNKRWLSSCRGRCGRPTTFERRALECWPQGEATIKSRGREDVQTRLALC